MKLVNYLSLLQSSDDVHESNYIIICYLMVCTFSLHEVITQEHN